jgi:DNA-binding PadR family transcriptional regulator
MPSPLSAAELQILLALTGGKRHGYAIAQEAAEQSDGRVRLGPGTLYGTLQRLQDHGWVATTEAPAGVDERRRYYRLTGAGRVALETEISRMEGLVRRARLSRARPAASKS